MYNISHMDTDDKNNISNTDVLRANINNETSRINWNELQRFFAGGWLIYVSSHTNLLDVAVAFSSDNKNEVSQWLASGEVAKVSDEQAKFWHEENSAFWANVIKPWVLIQPVAQTDTPVSLMALYVSAPSIKVEMPSYTPTGEMWSTCGRPPILNQQ